MLWDRTRIVLQAIILFKEGDEYINKRRKEIYSIFASGGYFFFLSTTYMHTSKFPKCILFNYKIIKIIKAELFSTTCKPNFHHFDVAC